MELRGKATTFNQPIDCGDYVLHILPGAFAKSLRSAAFAPVCCWDHDRSKQLASSFDRPKTLFVFEMLDGVYCRIVLPNHELGHKVWSKAQDGKLKMSVHLFYIDDYFQEFGGRRHRFVREAILSEVSIVEVPACKSTFCVPIKPVSPTSSRKPAAAVAAKLSTGVVRVRLGCGLFG